MLSVSDALARILEQVPRLPVDDLPLFVAGKSFICRDVIATRPLPGFDQSAMDGFAARAAELPASLSVAATIVAGAVYVAPLAPGTAARIMTGAPMPAGADCVVVLEDARDGGATVELPAARAGENVRREGEDVAPGDRVIAQGAWLGPGEVALLAALGFAKVPITDHPSVAIVATGDELIDVDDVPERGEVVDSTHYALAEQVAEAGGRSTYLGAAPDDRAATAALITRALAEDVVITTGGVSAGERDFVRDALADAGVELDFWKVAMKPGKPLAFGLATRGATRVPVFALPGNPVSSMVAFELFVRPALLAMQGAALVTRPRAPVILPRGYQKPAGRAHFVRARVHRNGAGLIAEPHPRQGSHALTSMVDVDALVELGAHVTEVAPGGTAPALLLRAV